MTRRERKAYKEGKRLGYSLGYIDGLRDGNPFIQLANSVHSVGENLKSFLAENPEFITESIKKSGEELEP